MFLVFKSCKAFLARFFISIDLSYASYIYPFKSFNIEEFMEFFAFFTDLYDVGPPQKQNFSLSAETISDIHVITHPIDHKSEVKSADKR